MKITVVGFWHGYPEKGDATSGYLLEKGDNKLLLDCGSGVLSSIEKYCLLSELNGVVLSHYHHDHMADIGVYQYAQILTASEEQRKVPTIYGHNDDKEAFSSLQKEGFVQAIEYKEGEPLEIGPFLFTFFKTNHPVPCYAMRIECDQKSIVYTADSSYMEELAVFADESDLLIAECSTYANNDLSQFGHMNSHDVGLLARRANTKELLLTHLPHIGDHQNLKREASDYFNGTISIATSGWTKEFK
ncbi:MBL fold metallo-hydrolase [Bacillus suaedae]|uniref:MBL fold metallo-hydrolase n=1 Tax=Halalkalibacter suaedae TaxID=2822140 RepID=A0A941AR09_9BACI|nr:MBL fold metallo-hydrolase [Bacillus suaedae]MBP3953472.1 MBL fold metallo-hydrolase [Bacillus suaedae]